MIKKLYFCSSFALMDFSLFLTFFHILGVALGVGGATVSDLLFFRAITDRRISKDEFAMLHTLGYVLWAGLIILFLSGVGFVTSQLIVAGSSSYLSSAWFWAKMTIVFTLFCNALVMHMKVFPFMTAHLDQELTYQKVKDKMILLSMTGVVSIVSWYSAMALGVTRGLDFSYFFIVNAYVMVLLVGILVAYILFNVSVFPPKRIPSPNPQTKISSVHKSQSRRFLIAFGWSLLLGIILISLAWYLGKWIIPESTVSLLVLHINV